MTEKRFEYVKITGVSFETLVEFANNMESFIAENGNTLTYQDILNTLNELYEENEQLKKQLKCSREEADDYCEELMGKDEFVRLYKRQRDDALKENEQLKEEIKNLNDKNEELKKDVRRLHLEVCRRRGY